MSHDTDDARYPVQKTDREWRESLDPTQYRVARHGDTERAFTGKYWNHWAGGSYRSFIVKVPVQRPEMEPVKVPSSSRPDTFTMNGTTVTPMDGASIQPEMPPSPVRLSFIEGPTALPLTKVRGIPGCG